VQQHDEFQLRLIKGETMTTDIQDNNSINDVQGLEIETFKIEELSTLDLNAAAELASIDISLCSSTTSSSCG
jgi:hypothetical protein